MAFVCIYVYVCLYVHMCVRTLIHGSLNIHTSICVSKCMYVYVLPGDIFNQIWVFLIQTISQHGNKIQTYICMYLTGKSIKSAPFM